MPRLEDGFRAIDTSRDDGSFVFCADNGEWYAVNAEGEQSPSFRDGREASNYLDSHRAEGGSAALSVLFAVLAVPFVWFVALVAGSVAGMVA